MDHFPIMISFMILVHETNKQTKKSNLLVIEKQKHAKYLFFFCLIDKIESYQW